MPQSRDENCTSFVHGHGAKYASDRKPVDIEALKLATDAVNTPISPLVRERVRMLAAAQLAFQRVAQRTTGGE
jgi:hypothetical protein